MIISLSLSLSACLAFPPPPCRQVALPSSAMPEVVAQESAIKPLFDSLRSSKAGLTVGLLIGKASLAPKHIVCAAIPAPPPADAGADSSSSSSSSNRVDGEWLAEQGRQIADMLAAGLSVIGVFLHASAKDLDSTLPILSSAARALSAPVILHSDSSRSAIAAKFLDSKAGSRPVTCPFSMDTASCSLYLAAGRVSIDASALYHAADVKSAIKSAVAQVEARIASSRVMLQDCLIDSSSSSEDLSLVKWMKKMGIASDVKQLAVSLLLPAQHKVAHRLAVDSDVRGRVRLLGSVAARAVIHGKESMTRVVEMLKQDAIASMQRRVSLAAEEAAAGEGEPGWVWLNAGQGAQAEDLRVDESSSALPVRVAVHDHRLPKGAISDYALPADGEQDIRSRLEEIAGETFKECALVWSETVHRPGVAGVVKATRVHKESGGRAASASLSAVQALWIILAVVVALAAMVVGRLAGYRG